jgi:hypothetical protein
MKYFLLRIPLVYDIFGSRELRTILCHICHTYNEIPSSSWVSVLCEYTQNRFEVQVCLSVYLEHNMENASQTALLDYPLLRVFHLLVITLVCDVLAATVWLPPAGNQPY